MSKIRLISGIYGSRFIETPKNNQTHPMGNRERQAIFNQVAEYLKDAVVLDAFAGSGAMGFEALSRGAASVDFLENNSVAVKTIKQNAKTLDCELRTKIIRKIDEEAKYDVIFVDPPYDNPQYSLVEDIAKLLKQDGILILSHPKSPVPPDFSNLTLMSDRHYAAACMKIYAGGANYKNSSRQDTLNSV